MAHLGSLEKRKSLSVVSVSQYALLRDDVLGITIEEYEAIDKEIPYAVTAFDKSYTAVGYADYITPKNAKPIGTHGQWHLRDCAVLTRNTFGKGTAWYLGSPVKEDEFYDTLIERVLHDAKLWPAIKPPAGVEFCVRQGNGKKVLFIINHTEEQKTVVVPRGNKELITGKPVGKELVLEAFGVAVVVDA